MKTAYFDCRYGAAGDMIFGALLDAGAPFETIRPAIEEGLGVHGIRLSLQPLMRGGIKGSRLLVEVDQEHDHHRHLHHIEEIVDRSTLPERVKTRCRTAWRKIAEAEARVHNSTAEKIHFHEVGALDAIADVTGSMLALELLGIERVECSPLVLGSGGTVHCAHGEIPVPAPATLEIVKGIPTEGGPFPFEMTTPTGAAVLTTLASAWGPQPLMAIEKIGHGGGSREIPGHTNFLRVSIGESAAPASALQTELPIEARRLALLITEIDDMSPELLGDLMPRLLAEGCLDTHFTPVQMKKNRPGTRIEVLCRPADRDKFLALLLRNTSTFGVKSLELDRFCLRRKIETIETDLGDFQIKIGYWGDDVIKVTPEYESCRRHAESAGIPLTEIYAHIQSIIRQRFFANGTPRPR